MKKSIICLVCLLVSFVVFGQNETKNVDPNTEKSSMLTPQFTGIDNANKLLNQDQTEKINNYLVANIKYPESAVKCTKEGTGVIQFMVSSKGEISDFKPVNCFCEDISNEIIRVLKTTDGMWTPGQDQGEPVAMQKEVSVVFNVSKLSQNSLKKKFTNLATYNFKQGNKNLFEKQKFEKALVYYNKGLVYLPYDESLLLARGMCKYELGDTEGASSDWNRVKSLGGSIPNNMDYNIEKMKGYEEMALIFK